MTKRKIKKILSKKNKVPLVCLTAYSKKITQIADKYCDIILVGDSLGMVLYGMKSTREVKLETMILHAKAVKKSVREAVKISDQEYIEKRNLTLEASMNFTKESYSKSINDSLNVVLYGEK